MSYRDLFDGTSPVFLPLGFLARLPYAIVPLATLLLLRSATGSYAFAGAAAGAQSLAIAVGGISLGRVAERCGLRWVGAGAAVANAAAVTALIFSVHSGRAGMLVAAMAAGLTQPQVGPLVRVHWSVLAAPHPRRQELVSSALAYEAAADELSFVLGPAAVGLLAGLATPLGAATPLAAAALLLLGAAVPFALGYHQVPQTPRPAPGPPRRGRSREQSPTLTGKLPVGRLAAMVTAMALIGAIFGVLQTALAAYATETGRPGAAGALYAGLGAGSAAAGLGYGLLPAQFALPHRYLTFTAALLAGMVVLDLGGQVIPLGVAVVLAGASIAPYMISVYALTERLTPTRVATAMTILTAGGPVGTAAGQALAGAVAQAGGHRAALALAPAAAALALLLACAVLTTDHRAVRRRHGAGPTTPAPTRTAPTPRR